MFYDEYFTRIEDATGFDKNKYNKKVEAFITDEKAKNLFEDCFSHHVDFDNPLINKLILNKEEEDNDDDKTRYIERDVLSAYFINHIYKAPQISKFTTNEEVEYENFVNNIAESAYSENILNNFSLGSNRLRFLVGEVGEGKSALTKKVLSTIEQNKSNYCKEYKICNIYINFEDLYNYGEKPILLQNDFPRKLYSIIKENVKHYVDIEVISNSMNPEEEPLLAIKMMLEYLKSNSIRLILYIDNIDFYHYYYSKYSYYEQYDEKQNESIDNNILWLYAFFTKKGLLGDQGLNILLSVRNYVYEDIIMKTNGTDTEINTTKAYKIKLVDESEVLYSRIQLLEQAVELINTSRTKNLKIEEFLQEIKTIIFFESMDGIDISDNSPVKIIYKIGQHGYRTLVHFFSSLNVAYLDFELIDRFLKKQVSSLVLLYYTNMYKKYTQQKEHFPNLFLNDCIVSYKSEFQDAHKEHKHTYWLKYFILKIIVEKPNIKVQKIIDIFCKKGNYDKHLVLHIIGSLETANEFRCIECDTDTASNNIMHRKLKATKRGMYLFESTNKVEQCFNISYLQIIVEDRWLSIPNLIINDFYDKELDYSYLYTTGKHYIDKSIEHTTKKAKSSLIFLKLLNDSYIAEIESSKKELHEFLTMNNLVPNLSKASDSIIKNTEDIIRSFKRDRDLYKVKDLKNILEFINDRDDIVEFFKDYHNDLDIDSKVR
jgi:hypothetical protein